MAVTDGVDARRAALLLHGMPSTVRAQIIARLDTAQSARLQPLLDELTALGITCELGRQLQAQLEVPVAQGSEVDVLRQADELNAAAVAQCLEGCADQTISELLRARPWSWKHVVLDRIHGPRRFGILQGMHDATPPAPAVLESLCRRLCADVAVLQANRADGSARASRAPFRPGVRRWLSWSP
jgi:hypothetical protein